MDWREVDRELERSFGQGAFSLLDLGSCCGFFSLQAPIPRGTWPAGGWQGAAARVRFVLT